VFFFVDETGHTGSNLFDPQQHTLYYGVLSSKVNLDAVVESRLTALRRLLGVPRIHASEVGNAGLVQIVPDLLEIQSRFDARFDLYWLRKTDFAVICFFDQVFDQGLNPAIPWNGYWTPLRYVLLLKVAYLFDEELLEAAWSARLDLADESAARTIVLICETHCCPR
jgi:hypothetical protein